MRQTERALDVLELLADTREASLAEVSASLDLPRASVHRLLVALAARGYVEHDQEGGVYRVGSAVSRLAAARRESALVRLAAPALADLRTKTGETVNLAVLNGSRIVYAATLPGTLQPQMLATVGHEVEPHATGLGKAILAELAEDERSMLLGPAPYPAYTPHTITDPEALAGELEASHRRGYAVEVGESALGAACIAAAIVDRTGGPVGALSISGVPARLPEEAYEALAAELRAWCERIASDLDDEAEKKEGPDFGPRT